MERKFTILLVLLLPYFVYAQKPDLERVKFQYVQPPMENVFPEGKNYVLNVFIPTRESIDSLKLVQQEKIDQAKEEFKDKLVHQNEASKEMGGFGKLLLFSNTPTMVLPEDQYYPKLRPVNLVRNTINITGCEETESNGDFKVDVMFKGFELMFIMDKEEMVKSETGMAVKKYKKEISFVQPVLYTVSNHLNEVVYEHLIEDSYNSEINKVSTGTFDSKDQLDSYWKANKISFLAKADEDSYRKYRNALNEDLTNKFGYDQKLRETYVAKGKGKADYADLDEAYGFALQAYLKISNDPNQDIPLGEAIKLWEKALSEADLTDKKARINKKIAFELRLNCAEAYIWTNDFENAEKHLVEAKIINSDQYEPRVLDVSALKEDMEMRKRIL